MNGKNDTAVAEYVLLEMALFVLCLTIYCLTLLGNSLLAGLIGLDSRLHNPMYFFLSNLSLIDISGTSSFMPLMLINFLAAQKTISFPSLALQMYLTLAPGATECLLLAAMAYDRFVAICQPLRYLQLMSGRMWMWMAALSWGTGFANSLLQSILVWRLPFCGHNVINHFCAILAVLKPARGDISLNALTIMVATAVLTLTPLLLICHSYIFILAAILSVPSAAGRHKAFSTCSAHLTVVVVFYRTISFMNLKPKAKDPDVDKLITLFYEVVTPSLNPIIYGLRNSEVKAAFAVLLRRDFTRRMPHFYCCNPALSVSNG
ncbi:PREDICTED: olfactory receptor 2S2-like [Dipodomys ordii]|uniref:Olfactory receptor n=1 Tax=Dipodomys ordii TaxID=10020 RepID=A0A1S3G159_DIPOR|nr:PREDICTED: olfactory receptor 2S2-like [Dipodomys ordii]